MVPAPFVDLLVRWMSILGVVQRWRIDPADVTIGAPIDQVEPAMSGVTKDHDLRARHVQLHDCLADGELLECGCRLGDDDRIELVRFLVAFVLGCGDHVARRLHGGHDGPGYAVRARDRAALEPAVKAAPRLSDADGRLIGARIGVRRHPFGLQRNARVEVEGAFGAKPEPLLPDRDVSEYPPSKYFPIASAIRALTRARNASP